MRPLPTPTRDIDSSTAAHVARSRESISRILRGVDDRLIAVVGPCSVHEPEGMHAYCQDLAAAAHDLADDLFIVVRAYTEKPRTRHGWPGLALDPDLDGVFDVPAGVRTTRAVLEAANQAGLAVASEFVEPMLAWYIRDLVSWGAIGARTVESPSHRRMASELDMPIGFKNRVDGALAPAVDAIAVASRSQPILGLRPDGKPFWAVSSGNQDGHLVLRGGSHGPNHSPAHIGSALGLLAEIQSAPKLLVDCSHGNSGKDHNRQPAVAESVASQIASGQHGIAGVLVESYLRDGAQPLRLPARYGVSVTDACLSLPRTVDLLRDLAAGVRSRRNCRVEPATVEVS